MYLPRRSFEVKVNYLGEIIEKSLTTFYVHTICRVQVPSEDRTGLMFEDGDVFAFSDFLCRSGAHTFVHRKYAWNSRCFLIMKLQEPFSFFIYALWRRSYFSRIMDYILSPYPEYVLGSGLMSFCGFDSSKEHSMILRFVVAMDIWRAEERLL